MKLVFEDIKELNNFTNCEDLCKSGIRRFTPAPILNYWPRSIIKEVRDIDTKYIIATGVNHCPEDWTGYNPYSRVDSLFKYLSPKYLKDLQNNQALLLIDQSLEGYHQTWIFDFFHQECNRYSISPSNIIYLTGNLLVKEDYNKWLKHKAYEEEILNVFPYMHFERDMYRLFKGSEIDSSTKTNLQYKKTNDIKLFNCLNKRDRPHRAWFYTKLYQNNLLSDGLINMNSFNSGHFMDGESIDPETIRKVNTTLPTWIDEPNNLYDDNFYINRFKHDVCLDSYVSVISEAHFSESSNTLFISEKTFKIIASRHPFIILGNRGSLQKLKDLGYKTFDGFIDESYDTLPTYERLDAIIKSLKKLKQEKNMLKWYRKIQPILNYNYNKLKSRSLKKEVTIEKIENLYHKKFGV